MNERPFYPIWQWTLWCVGLPTLLLVLALAAVATVDDDVLMFDNAHLWWLAVVGPIAGLLAIYGVWQRRRAMNLFASQRLAPLLAESFQPSRQAIRAGMVVSAIVLIAAGIIGPRWGVYLEKQRVHGVDIVVAIDVSRSMWAQDVQPNRLERAKQEIRQQLIDRAVFQHSNRLALLAFAGSTSLKLPLTTDHIAFRTKLDAVHVGSAPRGGTAIAEAILASADLFAKSSEESTKVILLFTDGEDHEGQPVDAAKEALMDQGVRTFTIGVGDPSLTAGAQLLIPDGTTMRPLLHEGQIVFSKLNVNSLRQIADSGNGRFAPIAQFHRLVDGLSQLRQTDLSTEERIRHRPRYQWFLAAALILLLIEAMMSERRATIETRSQRVWQHQETSA